MSLYGGIGRSALLLGPLAGGFIGEAVGFRAAFAAAAVLLGAAMIPVLVAGPGADGRPPPGGPPRLRLRPLVRHHGRVIGLTGLGQLGVALVRVGRLTVVPLYGAAIGLDLSDVGVVVAIAGGLDLILFPVAGWTMDRFGRLYAIVPSFLLMAVGLLAIPLAHSFRGLAIVVVVAGLGNGLGAGTMLTLATDLAPAENTAEVLSALRLLADLGRVLGPLAVGLVADHLDLGSEQLDLGASAVVLGVIAIITALLFVVAIGETRLAVPAGGHH
jgi:MFS family permease